MNDLEKVEMFYWLLSNDPNLSSSSSISSSSISSSSTSTTTSSSSFSSDCDMGSDDMETSSRMFFTTDAKISWELDETKVLINSVEAHYDELSDPTKKKHVWQNVCNDLIGQNIEVTPSMCSKKWYNLVRSYRVCKNYKKKNGPVRFRFFDTLDNLLGRKCANATADDIPTSNVQNEETEESSDNHGTKRKYSLRKEYLMKKAQWRKRKHENNEQKLELKRMQLAMYERKVKVLKALAKRQNRI